jgi:serine phosphatase RsbU (regulator of sigma subunit)
MSTQLDRLYDTLAAVSAHRGEASRLATRAADLLSRQAPVQADQTNDQVLALLTAHPALESLAVVEGTRPIGLINRHIFMEAYAKPFAREIFGRRTCIAWMDKAPLVADAATPLETLVQRAVETGAKALKDGFIVTEGGAYAGLGGGFALLEAISAVEAEKTRQLLESIQYASRIQRSYLSSSDEALAAAGLDHALLWEPRDVVGGDCYFVRRIDGGLFAAVLDCTGHGVPGAFMTLIALSFLEAAFAAPGASRDPGQVLTALNGAIKRVLGQTAVEGSEDGEVHRSDDGLDGACLFLPDGGGELEFAGARIPLLRLPPGDAPGTVLEAEKASVGYLDTPADRRWATQRAAVAPGTMLAIATDGIVDQPGGPKRIAHGRTRLLQLLGEQRDGPAREVAARFGEAFAAWQGTERRRDDVALLLLRAGGRP